MVRHILLVLVVLIFAVARASKSKHTNNWAVLVDTSKFWFNYRHVSNTLAIYRVVKKLGIPDSRIILMLADDMACDPRNPFAGQVFRDQDHALNVVYLSRHPENIEVDYRGYEVTAEALMRVLTNRHEPGTPNNKRLRTDDKSNVLVYLSGHGGDEFIKFQDAEEISSQDLADAFQQMWQKKRYHELVFLVDTCQAVTLYNQVDSPNMIMAGSSQLGQNSYSHHNDPSIGVSVIDRWTYYILDFFEKMRNRKMSMQDLFDSMDPSKVASTPGYRSTLGRPLDKVPVTDFFGSSTVATRPTVGAPDVASPGGRNHSDESAETQPQQQRALHLEKQGGFEVNLGMLAGGLVVVWLVFGVLV